MRACAIPSSRAPVVNYAIIAVCSVVFVVQVAQESHGRDTMVWTYGMIPARVTHPGRVTFRWTPGNDIPTLGLRTTGAYWLRDLRPRDPKKDATIVWRRGRDYPLASRWLQL